MSKIAYIRVSIKEQNTARQYELLKERNIVPDKVYEEHISDSTAGGLMAGRQQYCRILLLQITGYGRRGR